MDDIRTLVVKGLLQIRSHAPLVLSLVLALVLLVIASVAWLNPTKNSAVVASASTWTGSKMLQPVPIPPQVNVSQYYVAPTGSDSSDGSLSHPWLTLQHAANEVVPGSTVHVAP
ncbi:MAG: hypothetical protein JO065_18095, partial [Acidobacteria bacterium]|nr:hypothetical protein [Acidobacteriota bacterium]